MPAIWIPKRLVEVSLINTAAESAASFARHCEHEYEGRVHAAASEVLASGCSVVMLTGPSASGKTTTAHKLAEALRLRGVVSQVVSLDNFYKNLNEYPRLPDGSKDYENITALDVDEIQRCLNELITTGRTELPEFDFLTENRKPEKIPLELKLPDMELPKIRCDRNRIIQILSVLMDNAMSYTGQGKSIELEIFLEKKYLCFSVADHGEGIPDSEKEAVFDRFYQQDKSRNQKGHFGLGLPVGKELAKLHKGDLILKDTPGGGCTFLLKIPYGE